MAEDQGRVRTALLALLAGGLAVIGAYYTHQTFKLNREGQITERYSRAIEQLGHGDAAVRIGAIFALSEIADTDQPSQSPREGKEVRLRRDRAIARILAAYVQTHAPWPPRGDGQQPAKGKPLHDLEPLSAWAPDVQTAITILGQWHPQDEQLNLGYVDLRRAQLKDLNFENTYLARGASIAQT